MRFVILLAASACSNPRTPPQPKAPAEPSLARVEPRDLRATLNGDRLTFASAFARSRSDGRVNVTVSTHVLSCATLDARLARDEVRFDLRLVRKLFPNGELGWRVEGREFENLYINEDENDPIDAEVDTQLGARSRIDVGDPNALKMVSNERSRTLLVWGTLDALGCGKDERVRWSPPSAQPAVIEVAGRSFPIVGAAFAEGTISDLAAGHRLKLGTAAVDCGLALAGEFITMLGTGDIVLELEFEPKVSPVAELRGDLIGAPGGVYRSEATGLTISGLPPSSSSAVVELTLGGKTLISPEDARYARVHGSAGYPVALRGKVRATVCPKPARGD